MKSIQYPDGLQFDAETLMVHPKSGNIYILSKSPKTYVFKLAARELRSPEISILQAHLILDHLKFITDGKIINDGTSLLLTNTKGIYQIDLDLDHLPEEREFPVLYSSLGLETLAQQEAITFAREPYDFIYTSEGHLRTLYEPEMVLVRESKK